MSNGRNYYVYVHINPITKAPFYIGKGTDRRAYEHDSRSDEWKEVYNRLRSQGLIHEVHILHICSSAQEAFDLEKIEIHLRTKAGQKLVNIIKPSVDVDKDESVDEESIPMFIRIKRKSLGYSQERMADRIGVSKRFYKELERGKKTCRMDKVVQVVNHLGGKISVKQ